ncbi:hypothetical protein H6G06_10225 [Anabaena sphaerica FACHB-251]|uniref:Uncharacterized protein n=1 Tax=Anabaena sphaerica FACHB-251 TaxID=2692883 RepID=A0A926WI10_9NOST|nr:hypothetical protein [Anabaena sphaerica]MBD2293861.1 hypothetical protein [Anabaena sphaerica FACHB-251]
MNYKVTISILIVFCTSIINAQKASAIELSPLVEKLGTQLIDRLLSPQSTPTNTPSFYPPQDSNYPSNSNYYNSYPPSSMPSYSPTYPPTQYSPSSPSMPMPFIYNPIIVVPQSPPVFNNYSNSVQR